MRHAARLLLGVTAIAGLAACASTPGPQADAPSHSRAYADYLIGRVAALRSDHEVASDRLYAAIQASPRDTEMRQNGVRAALANGDADRAIALSRDTHGEQTPAVILVRSVDALRSDRYGAARNGLDGLDGGLAEIFSSRLVAAWAKAGEGHVDDAAADLQRLSGPPPLSGVFAFSRALILDHAGRASEAIQAYEMAEQQQLFFAPGVARHARLLVSADRRDEAIALLQGQGAYTTNPEIVAALRDIRAGSAAPPASFSVASGAALSLFSLAGLMVGDNNEDALIVLSLALALDPRLDGARITFAQTQRDTGQVAVARRALDEVPAGSLYAETARLTTAWILRDDGRQADAIAAAQAVGDGSAGARLALADLYRTYERYGDAEPIYSALIGESSTDWRLYFARGATRERLGRWADAETDFRRALTLSPDQPEVLNYLGYSLVDRGERLSEGLGYVRRAAELRPQSGAILDSLGWAYFQLGRYNDALTALERAVELEPADPVLNDHLGDGYWRVGRRIEARYQWQRVLTLSPSVELRTSVERKIEAGLPAQRAAAR